jgi:hypothetical protein
MESLAKRAKEGDVETRIVLSPTRKAQGVQEFRKYLRKLKDRREEIAPNLVGLTSAIDYVLRHLEFAIAEAIRPLKGLPTDTDPLDI